MNKLSTPLGVTDYIPVDAEQYQKILHTLSSLYSELGYQHIKTPTLEFFNTLSVGLGSHLKERCLRFFDSAGDIVVLRPDHTAPISRLVASQMTDQSLPIKLSYMDPVFRRQVKDHDDIEIYQSGIEFIGQSDPKSEADIIATCIRGLLELGFTDFGIDIGHTDFAKDLSEDQKQALLKGDYVEFGEIPARGGKEVVSDYSDLLDVFNYLEQDNLSQYVSFNKGLVKDFQYYTGIIFDAYIKSTSSIVASGGRYDNLLGKFGFESPAIGFAYNINLIHQSITKGNKS